MNDRTRDLAAQLSAARRQPRHAARPGPIQVGRRRRRRRTTRRWSASSCSAATTATTSSCRSTARSTTPTSAARGALGAAAEPAARRSPIRRRAPFGLHYAMPELQALYSQGKHGGPRQRRHAGAADLVLAVSTRRLPAAAEPALACRPGRADADRRAERRRQHRLGRPHARSDGVQLQLQLDHELPGVDLDEQPGAVLRRRDRRNVSLQPGQLSRPERA